MPIIAAPLEAMAVLGELFPLLIRINRGAFELHEKFSNAHALGFVLVGIPVYYMTQRHEDTDSPLIVGERHHIPQTTADHTEHKFSRSFFSADRGAHVALLPVQRCSGIASQGYVAGRRLARAGKQ